MWKKIMGILVAIKPFEDLTTVVSVFTGEQTVVDVQTFQSKTPPELLNLAVGSYHDLVLDPWVRYQAPLAMNSLCGQFVPIVIDDKETWESLYHTGLPCLNGTIIEGERTLISPILSERCQLDLTPEQLSFTATVVNGATSKMKEMSQSLKNQYDQLLDRDTTNRNGVE